MDFFENTLKKWKIFYYNKFVHPPSLTNNYIFPNIKDFKYKNKKILDFGCGTGNNCVLFDTSLYLGVDISADSIKYAQKKYPKYRFEHSNNGKIPTNKNSIEVLFISLVLHHMSDQEIEKQLLEFKRILKPKSQLICIEPCFYPDTPIKNTFMKYLDKGNYIRYESQYLTLINKSFNIKTTKRLNYFNVYNNVVLYGELL
jgi:ubiquinone/menaquinone biosynthesis C-methylase UbiE